MSETVRYELFHRNSCCGEEHVHIHKPGCVALNQPTPAASCEPAGELPVLEAERLMRERAATWDGERWYAKTDVDRLSRAYQRARLTTLERAVVEASVRFYEERGAVGTYENQYERAWVDAVFALRDKARGGK